MQQKKERELESNLSHWPIFPLLWQTKAAQKLSLIWKLHSQLSIVVGTKHLQIEIPILPKTGSLLQYLRTRDTALATKGFTTHVVKYS